MRNAVDQLYKTKFQKPVAYIRIRKMKNLVLLLFATGFFCFLIFGAHFVDDITLLDAVSLRRIRDVGIDKKDFLRYLCASRLVLFGLFALIWWYRWGKECIYTWIAFGAWKVGVCLAVALVRYRLQGVILWFTLYVPHIFFYFFALLCGLKLCKNVGVKKSEKIRYLLQNIIWIFCVMICLGIGIYVECYVSSGLLHKYLEIF